MCTKSASNLHQICTKCASNVHQICIKCALTKYDQNAVRKLQYDNDNINVFSDDNYVSDDYNDVNDDNSFDDDIIMVVEHNMVMLYDSL